MSVDWSKIPVEKDRGRYRGTYRLAEEDREHILRLLKEFGSPIVFDIKDVRRIFYRGKGGPSAAAMVLGLNRTFGDTFRFGVRDKGRKISVALRPESR